MPTAATTIRALSMPLEHDSALEQPTWCCRYAGRAARVRAQKAVRADTRFTPDSRASESRPTEPVRCKARVFRPMVARAAATESRV
jgi:hypothetical protein